MSQIEIARNWGERGKIMTLQTGIGRGPSFAGFSSNLGATLGEIFKFRIQTSFNWSCCNNHSKFSLLGLEKTSKAVFGDSRGEKNGQIRFF